MHIPISTIANADGRNPLISLPFHLNIIEYNARTCPLIGLLIGDRPLKV